jgi:uncharacterized membrane protein (UPF0182 family)
MDCWRVAPPNDSVAMGAHKALRGDMCNRILESDSMNNVFKMPFFRQVERWLVSVVMAVIAYMLEKAVLRSIRRGEAKRRPHDQSST